MKKLNLNGNEVQVPESWEEISISCYKRIVEIKDLEGKDLVKDINSTQRVAALLSKVLSISIEEVYKLTIPDFNAIITTLKFLEEVIPNKTIDEIEILGEKYYVKSDIDKFSVGEMISLEVYVQQDPSFINLIAPSLALMLRKRTDNGGLAEFEAEKFTEFISTIEQNVSIADVFGLCAFFFSNAMSYMERNSGNSLTTGEAVEKTEQKEPAL